jgi:hypothetical protein
MDYSTLICEKPIGEEAGPDSRTHIRLVQYCARNGARYLECEGPNAHASATVEGYHNELGIWECTFRVPGPINVPRQSWFVGPCPFREGLSIVL